MKRNEFIHFSWLPAGGFALIIFSLFLSLGSDHQSLYWKVGCAAIAELGFAAIIAYVVILAVDRHEKEEFRKYVQRSERRLAARNVLSTLLDADLPKAVSDQLESFIGGSSLVKREQTIAMAIAEVDEQWLEVTQTYEYTAYNSASHEVKENVGFYFDFDRMLPKHLASRCGIIEYCVERRGGTADRFEIIKQARHSPPAHMDSKSNPPVEITLSPLQEIRIHVVLKRIKRVSDTELWRNSYLCEGLKLHLMFDKSKLFIEHLIIHPTKSKARERETHDGMRLEFTDPLLPSNGVLLWWGPAPVPEAPASEVSVPEISVAGTPAPGTPVPEALSPAWAAATGTPMRPAPR